MKPLKAGVISIIFIMLFSSWLAQAEGFSSLSDCLVVEDIARYSFRAQSARMGNGSGAVGLTGHFRDHMDVICTGSYSNINEIRGLPIDEAREKIISVDVEVTQHAGSDSDKWLLHELDMDFRNYYGLPGRSYGPRQIEGQTILEDAAGGRNYRWMSGNKLIVIEYHDAQMTKPEPLEVVKAYLAKHRSTLTPMKLAELRSPEMKTIWIKDEMDRRLWLCDKWFLHVQLGKADLSEVLQTVVKYLSVFLDYRERYYGIAAREEKIRLLGYLELKDGTAIKNKLSEYKTWWSVNKAKSISLP